MAESTGFKSTQEVAEFLKDSGIDLDYKIDYYIGSGANGDVYKIKGKNKVIKIEKYNSGVFDTLEKMMEELESEYIAKIFFLREYDGYTITVLEFLKDAQSQVSYTTRAFEWFLLYIEEAFQEDTTYGKPSYKNVTNLISAERNLIERGFDEKKIKTFFKVFGGGAETNLRGLISIIFHFNHQINGAEKNEFLDDCINNKQLILTLCEAVQEMVDMGITHGDIHIDNILYDDKTGNFKLIDPFEI